ncbi:MAG: N-acetylneuraminate synthase family protein [Elusimicrobiales bacterium]
MRIYFKAKSDEIVNAIKKMFRCRIKLKDKFIEIDGFKKGYIYNYIPRIKALYGVSKIETKYDEIMPIISGKNFYFTSPLNTKKKIIIAGPCVIHDFDEFERTVTKLKNLNVYAIRTPLFKPRTSPYSWEGFGLNGLKKLLEIKKKISFISVMEILDPRIIEKVSNVCDIIQIGARNMRNYQLLKEAARSKKTLLIKRHPHSSVTEFLFSAEYIAKYGCSKIILCERGDYFSDDISSINLEIIKEIKKHFKIPIIADVSHSAKDRKIVFDFALKSWEISDGIMIEVMENPHNSPTDTKQIISIDEFKRLIESLK